MITIESSRNNGVQHDPTAHEKDPSGAFTSLAVGELGHGGQIVELSSTMVQVKTKIRHTTDTVTFTGPAEEMKDLVMLAGYHNMLMRKSSEDIIDLAVDQMMKICDGSLTTLIGTSLSLWIIGGMTTRASVLAALKLVEEESGEVTGLSEEDAETVRRLSLKDFVSLAQLSRDMEMPLAEVASQLEM